MNQPWSQRSCLAASGLTLLALQVACGSDEAKAPADGLQIAVAPLTLPGLGRACYDLRVTNAADGGGETVWSRGTPGLNGGGGDAGAICSDTYGNATGGDITFIGPCDASGQLDADPAGERVNSVTLWLDGLYTTGGAYLAPDGADAWQNPCGAPLGCTLNVTCEENADALVEFNLTIMRDANQGFFDIAVNFEDIFCSAKLDTCYPSGQAGTADDRPIELLFGADLARDWTAVVGFACTSGTGTTTSELFYGPIVVDCGDEVFTVDPTQGPGETSVTGVNGAELHYGVYRGSEDLICGGGPGSCQKLYWNLALSLDDLEALGGSCSLALSATAADAGTFTSGLPSGAGLGYPYIDVATQLTTNGAATCQQNSLNAQGSAVTTAYRGNLGGLSAASAMCSAFLGGTPTSTGAAGCGPVAPTPSCTDNIQNQDETGVDCGGSVCEPCVDTSALLDCDDQPVDTSALRAFEFTATLNDGTPVVGWYAFSTTNVLNFFDANFPNEISYFFVSPGAFRIYARFTANGTTSCFELDPTTPGATIYVANDDPGDGYGILDITMNPAGPGASGNDIQPSFFLYDASGTAIPTSAGLSLPETPYSPALFPSTNTFNVNGWSGSTTGTLTSLTLH